MDTQIHTPIARPWMTTAPTVPGLYQFTCEESDGTWEVVQVDTWLSLRRRHGCAWCAESIGLRVGLYVDCPHLGVLPVIDYHDGKTAPRWRLVDPLLVEQMAAEDSAANQMRDSPGFGNNLLDLGAGLRRLPIQGEK